MASYVNGSVAVDLEQHAEFESPSPRLVVIDVPEHLRRKHAQSQGQTALSPLAVTAIKCAVAFVAVVVLASFARSLLMANAFGFAYQNASLNSQLEEARSLGAELEVKQSVFGSAERIESIATDVYGMVPVSDVAVLDLAAVPLEEPEPETATE